MSNPASTQKHVKAVLNMPDKIGDKILKAKFIQQKLTGNTNFPTPFPANITSLVQFGTDITALDAAETAAQNRTKGASAIRDQALEIVIKDLKSLMTMVQNAADADTANAEAIIQNAGFDVKSPTIKQKQGNTAISNNVPGVVDLTADGTGPHEWQMSKDQVTITQLNATLTASTTITGLTSGDLLNFRNRKIDSLGGGNPWSPWIQVKVK